MNEFKKSYNDMISLGNSQFCILITNLNLLFSKTDQYIQENMADDQVCMIDRPKHRLDPDEEAKLRAQLDNDLKGQNIKLQEHYKNYSKFDRLEDRNSDEDEDDRYETQSTLTMFSEDVVMRDLNSSKQNFHEIEEIQQDDLHLCRIKQPFRTLESKIGAHGDSQSWRLDRENALGKRPQNMPYLTTSKNRNNNMNSRTHNGRIRKPKTRQNGSIYLTHENKNP